MTPRRTLAATAALCAVLAGCGQAQDANPGTVLSTAPAVATTTPEGTGTTATSAPAGGSGTSSTPAETGGSTGDGSPTTSNTGPGATGTTGATTGGTTATQTSPAGSGGPAGVSVVEKTPEDYGDAAIAAWTQGDKAGLARYVSPTVRTDVAGEAPAGKLLRAACEGDMCSYTTEDGKRVTLTFDLAKVRAGKSGGITAVKVG